MKEVGRDLGVRYVLEGSIQTSGDRVRVTAQLIEAATNAHVWSDRYDRALDDIFEVQNEVTQKIAAALGGSSGILGMAEAASIRRKPPANLQAYDYYILGTEFLPRLSEGDKSRAEDLLNKAIQLDPQFARAYSGLGLVYLVQAFHGWGKDAPSVLIEKAKSAQLKAISLDSNDARAHALLGEIYAALGDFDHSLASFEQAFSLNQNDPDILMHYGGSHLFAVGQAAEAIKMINRAFRLNPRYPPWYDIFVDPFYANRQYERVISTVHRTNGDVNIWNYMMLAMSYAQLGRQSDAAGALAELQRRFRDCSFERMLSEFGQIKDPATLALYLDGVHKAGLRECATADELQKYSKMTHLALCDAKRATN